MGYLASSFSNSSSPPSASVRILQPTLLSQPARDNSASGTSRSAASGAGWSRASRALPSQRSSGKRETVWSIAMFLRPVRYRPRRSCGRICPVGEIAQPFLVARLVPGNSCECAPDMGPLELLIQPTCDDHIACGSCMRARQSGTSAFCDVAELLQLKVQQPLRDARMCSKKTLLAYALLTPLSPTRFPCQFISTTRPG